MKRMFGGKNGAVSEEKSRFPNDPAIFPTTRWSRVRAAGESVADGRDAFAGLCRDYWPPLFAYLRRRGFSESDAEDLTQGFFLHLLEHHTTRRAELFDVLAGFLDVTGNSPALEEAADALNLSAGALRTAISRLRKQFGDQLRLEIARTVSAPHEIEEEFRHLRTILTIGS